MKYYGDVKFIGRDGSMGLVNGRTYRIKITRQFMCFGDFWVNIDLSDKDVIYANARMDMGMMVRQWKPFCPYSSLEALKANWDLDAVRAITQGEVSND